MSNSPSSKSSEASKTDSKSVSKSDSDSGSEIKIPEDAYQYMDTIDIKNVDPADFIRNYDPECVRKLSNFASSNPQFLFDHENHVPLTRENLKVYSPKLLKIIEEIERQDAQDMQKHGRKFKHFIFSTIKSGTGGAKIIATALIDILGMNLGYTAKRVGEKSEGEEEIKEARKKLDMEVLGALEEHALENPYEHMEGGKKKEKIWKKIELSSEKKLLTTKFNNFFALSSVGVYQQPISITMRKEILRIFNSRTESGNSYGEKARIMVMDGGFKEGIDLFDVKYVHIFEPQTTPADQKQVIGRGTRLCGQKGLVFHPRRGWNLYVNIYDSIFPDETQFAFMNSQTAFDLYMKALGIDMRLVNLTSAMENICIEGSIDYNLNRSIHGFKIDTTRHSSDSYSPVGSASARSDRAAASEVAEEHARVTQYVDDNFSQFKWDDVEMKKMCGGAAPTIVKYTPTQGFISNYFTPANPYKGMLLYNSVGTGKTCTAIATATASFEKEGYTILWVTRTTLKNDIWKNMFDMVCSHSIREKIEAGVKIPERQPERMKLLSKAWSIRPMSYKQFSNLVSGKNSFYTDLLKRNGQQDPLRKTLIIIDEAHKLYGDSGLSTIEQPDMGLFYDAVMKSYEVSGENSCRLIMMTATPITKSPMEIVQLLNLCRERRHRITDNFESFATEYLDQNGYFSPTGRVKFLNEIAGYISYLNREKDARSFAQPIVKYVKVNILDGPTYREQDVSLMRKLLNNDLDKYKTEINNIKEIKKGNKEASAAFVSLKKVCDNYDGKMNKACGKITNQTRKVIRGYITDHNKILSDKTKSVRDSIKEFKTRRKEILKEISLQAKIDKLKKQKGGKGDDDDSDFDEDEEIDEIRDLVTDYDKYRESSFYKIKNKCFLKPKLQTFESYHTIVHLRNKIATLKDQIILKKEEYRVMNNNYKKRITLIKKTIQDPAEVKRQLDNIKEIILDAKENQKDLLEDFRHDIKQSVKAIKEQKKMLLKAFREAVQVNKERQKELNKENKKIDKENEEIEIDIEDLVKFIKDDEVVHMINKTIAEMKDELDKMAESFAEENAAKEQKKQEIADAKEQKARDMAAAKDKKARDAALLKEQKAREAAEAKEKKALAAAEAKEQKAQADLEAKEKKLEEKTRKHLEKQSLNKTAKVRSKY